MSESQATRWLRVLMLLYGYVSALAILTFLMPWSWMASTHEALGLGPLEHSPVLEYLARGVSGLCGFYGLLLIFLARDVRRFRPLIRFQAIFMIVFTGIGGYLTWCAGMPLWWPVIDTGLMWIGCGTMLWLLRFIPEPGG